MLTKAEIKSIVRVDGRDDGKILENIKNKYSSCGYILEEVEIGKPFFFQCDDDTCELLKIDNIKKHTYDAINKTHIIINKDYIITIQEF